MVKQRDELAPQFESKSPFTLVKESKDPRYLLAFMVAAQQVYVLGVLDLVG